MVPHSEKEIIALKSITSQLIHVSFDKMFMSKQLVNNKPILVKHRYPGFVATADFKQSTN